MTITDQNHSVNAVLSKRALDKHKFKDPSFHIYNGDLLRLENVEIRITDCFDPPQLELWIGSFDIIEHRETTRPSKPVEEDPVVDHYIRQYRKQLVYRMAEPDDKCSVNSFKSQVRGVLLELTTKVLTGSG